MQQEPGAYGRFFNHIPYGGSVADAYDRGGGFNESPWRCFAEADFFNVLAPAAGLMARVSLTKWYSNSVGSFEGLRGIENCRL